jgi:homoserine kinase
VLALRLKKRIPSNLGSQSAALVANVVAFINNLGPEKKPKMLRVAPSFFSPNS